MKPGQVAFLLLLLSSRVLAADLHVRVVDGKDAPVSDAVVRLLPLEGQDPPPPAVPARTAVVDQVKETFVPYVAVLRPGDSVVFRNSDRTRHHVYSFSPTSTFEFVVLPGQSSPPLRIGREGIVAVGCNIHDHMRNWLYVSASDRIAVTGGTGAADFGRLGPGRYEIHVWHPQLRPRQPELVRTIVVGAANGAITQDFQLSLLPDPRLPMGPGAMSY